MENVKMNVWEHVMLTSDIHHQIMEHMNAIRELEKKLEDLNTDDICEDLDIDQLIPAQSLWRNLERIEKRPSSYARSCRKFDEEPCYSVLDLVVEKLLHTPKWPLQLKGCSIQTSGTTARFCISGEVDGSSFVQNTGWVQLRGLNKRY